MPEHNINCFLCGEELVYFNESTEMFCSVCGKPFQSYVRCQSGHYVCDSCHSLDAMEFIKAYCSNSDSMEPLKLADDIMRYSKIKMHGPEHHFLVPAVLITAYYNYFNEPTLKLTKLEEALKRSKNVLGGFCGYYGCCGAAMGTGIFVSLIKDATPLSKLEWKLANLITATSLMEIAKFGGPRCCKRDTFLAINKALDFLENTLAVKLNRTDNIKCEFSARNKECLKENCQYFKEMF